MELVKEKYKKTEIGIIPEDWNIISFGNTFNFLKTASYSRDELSENEDIYYVHYGDIHTKWKHYLDFDKNTLPTINIDKAKNYSVIKEGDLIIADASEDYEGICVSVEVKNVKEKSAISGLHTFLLRDNNNYFVNGYKGYLYKNRLIKKQFNRLANGLKVYGVSKANLKTVLIPLPSKKEQSAIANALSDIDELINGLEKLIAKKRNIKQGAMQELLKPKIGWEVNYLGKICSKITTGRLDANAMEENGEYRFYTCAKEYFFINKYAFDDEALLISGNGENVGYIHYYKGKFNAYQRTYVLTGFKEDIQFVKLYLDKYLPKRIDSEVNAGNTPYIKMGTLSEMIISYPKLQKEQKNIATILSEMEKDIVSLETKLDKYRLLKQGMMQNLLTGKIRLI